MIIHFYETQPFITCRMSIYRSVCLYSKPSWNWEEELLCRSSQFCSSRNEEMNLLIWTIITIIIIALILISDGFLWSSLLQQEVAVSMGWPGQTFKEATGQIWKLSIALFWRHVLHCRCSQNHWWNDKVSTRIEMLTDLSLLQNVASWKSRYQGDCSHTWPQK